MSECQILNIVVTHLFYFLKEMKRTTIGNRIRMKVAYTWRMLMLSLDAARVFTQAKE